MSVKGKFSPEQVAELERLAQTAVSAIPTQPLSVSDPDFLEFAHRETMRIFGAVEPQQRKRRRKPVSRERVRRKRDPAILYDRDTKKLLRVVTQQTAAKYAGVGIRNLSRHIEIGNIVAEGGKANRRVIVESLLDFYPPEK
jgi:hypothetical protein